MAAEAGPGHGWWPYVAPYFAFLAVVEVARKLPEGLDGLGLLAKPAVPAALLILFAARGAYPELRGVRFRLPAVVRDALFGIGLAGLWMAPYLIWPVLRPAAPEPFDAHQLGAGLAPLALAVRMAGYACVTPIFEEVFIRSFVMRYAEVFRSRGDFRRVPIAHWSWASFATTVVVFTAGHQPWEWWVAVPWVVATNLWFYHTRDLWSVIRVHAVTNAAILVAVVAGSGRFSDGAGGLLSLWFFV